MKSGMGKLLTFIMAAFLLVFAGYHAYRHFFSDYTTENVYRYTVYHSTTAQGVFFREEKSLDQSAGSNLRYAVRDGEKVRVGSVLAYRYSDALSADLAERRAEAQKELTMLQQQYPYRKRPDQEYRYRPAKAGGSGGTGAVQRDGYPGAEPAGGDQPGQRHYRENRGAGSPHC